MTQDMHERDYSYSRLFDVHIWSDYSEVNLFVNLIYHDRFSKSRTNNVKKKHLKKVLIDLYVAWTIFNVGASSILFIPVFRH